MAGRCAWTCVVAAGRPAPGSGYGVPRSKEIRMSSVVRVWSVVALLVALGLVPVAAAENEQLQAAIDLSIFTC